MRKFLDKLKFSFTDRSSSGFNVRVFVFKSSYYVTGGILSTGLCNTSTFTGWTNTWNFESSTM